MDVTFITSVNDTSAGSTLTFSSVDIGTPASDRLVVVICTFESTVTEASRTIESCTIGGVSATRAVHVVVSSPTAIFYLPVATGTSADVDVVCSGQMARGTIGVWTVVGQGSNTPITTDTDLDSDGGHTGLTVSVDIPAEAGGICAAANGSPVSFTWSGATERYDVAPGSSQFSGADIQPTGSARNGHSISTSHSSSSQSGSLCVAVWEAAQTDLTASTSIGLEIDADGLADKTGVADAGLNTELDISGSTALTLFSSTAIDLDFNLSGDSQKHTSASTDIALSVGLDGLAQKQGQSSTTPELNLTTLGESQKFAQSTSTTGFNLDISSTTAKFATAASEIASNFTLDADSMKNAAAAASEVFTVEVEATSSPTSSTDINIDLGLTASAIKKAAADSNFDINVTIASTATKLVGSSSAISAFLTSASTAFKGGSSSTVFETQIDISGSVPITLRAIRVLVVDVDQVSYSFDINKAVVSIDDSATTAVSSSSAATSSVSSTDVGTTAGVETCGTSSYVFDVGMTDRVITSDNSTIGLVAATTSRNLITGI